MVDFYLVSKRASVIIILLVCFVVTATASPGSLDTTFGTNGIYNDALTNHASYTLTPYDLVQQPDGMILVVGSYNDGLTTLGTTRVLLRRYTRNGPFDSQFGLDGFAVANRIQGPVEVYGVGRAAVVQSDYKIVVAGFTYATNNSADTRLTLWRFTSGGELDTTFGVDGQVTLFSPSVGKAAAVRMSQGKILVAGNVTQASTDYTIMTRLNLDGTIDPSFGMSGIVIAGSASGSTLSGLYEIGGPRALAVQSVSGDIFLSGHYTDASHHLGIARYDQAGNPVLSFGTNGVAMTPAGLSNGSCILANSTLTKYSNILLYTDGSVGATGSMGDLAASFFFSYFLGRYGANGVADTGFAQVGHIKGPCLTNPSRALDSTVLQSDGKIVYLAPANSSASQTLFRVNSDGTQDTTYVPPNLDFGYTQFLMLQGATKTVRLGVYTVNTNKVRVKLARYLP